MTKLQFPYQLNYGTDITVFNSPFLASIILRTSLIKNYGGFNIEFRHSLGFEQRLFLRSIFLQLTNTKMLRKNKRCSKPKL